MGGGVCLLRRGFMLCILVFNFCLLVMLVYLLSLIYKSVVDLVDFCF